MTQKELAYFEDAINHENSIVKICQDALGKLQDEKLVSFMEQQQIFHKTMQQKLMNMLKEKANG